MIKNDVIEAFNAAVEKEQNLYENGDVNWDFVDADLWFECQAYSAEYLNECFNVLVDNYLA
jgi:hypothetical protein